uniref:Uncharacterized protein n=1 Tax=Marseillevirus LCMAC103 TaxID=2506604 RepID=A0A481YWC3_9VIRU|nr:MAG: hypothetical protein LCMAC103_04190 [Marseillevirus LCMAC103]
MSTTLKPRVTVHVEPEVAWHATDKSSILDAITGYRTLYRVGSKDEVRFWKVRVATTRDQNTYFFTSPEAHERSTGVTIDAETKSLWRLRRSDFLNANQKHPEEHAESAPIQTDNDFYL